MGEKTDAFYNQMTQAILPTLRWTKEDERSLWNMPFSLWSDYFSLKKAKRQMMNFYAKHQVVRKMPKLVPTYIKAVQKGRLMTMDYLQAYGDVILAQFVQNHFRRKYGLNSKQWQDFVKKEKILWENIVKMRQERQELFLRKKIMSMEKIPAEIRQRILKNNDKKRLKRCLVSYYHYQDGEDREGKKMPFGLKPPPTSLVILENPKKEEKKPKKPLPPLRLHRDSR